MCHTVSCFLRLLQQFSSSSIERFSVLFSRSVHCIWHLVCGLQNVLSSKIISIQIHSNRVRLSSYHNSSTSIPFTSKGCCFGGEVVQVVYWNSESKALLFCFGGEVGHMACWNAQQSIVDTTSVVVYHTHKKLIRVWNTSYHTSNIQVLKQQFRVKSFSYTSHMTDDRLVYRLVFEMVMINN